MTIKTLQYDDFMLYRERIRDLLVQIYDINFDVSMIIVLMKAIRR